MLISQLPVCLLIYQSNSLKKVKKAAILEKTDYQTLINCFVHQALGDSQAEVKRLKFEQHVKKTLKKHKVHPDALDEIFNALEFY